MAVKKLIVHLGGPKTGSSSIQAALFNNPELLEKNCYRFLYEWGWNHNWALHNLFPGHRMGQSTTFVLGPEERERRRRELRQGLLEARQAADGKNLIISGEYIHNFLFNLDSFNLFKSFLNEYFLDVETRLILYVRNPVIWQISLWQSFMLSGYIVKNRPDTDWHQMYADYYNVYFPIFIKENKDILTLVKFEDAVGDQDGLVGHFLKLIGFPENELKGLTFEHKNEGRCAEALEFITFAEDREPTYFDHPLRLNPKRGPWDFAETIFPAGAKFDFAYRDKLAMLERCRPGIQWFKDNAGIDYTDYKVEPQPEPETYSEETINGFQELFPTLTPVLQELFLEFFEKKYNGTGQEKFRRLYALGSVPRAMYEEARKLRDEQIHLEHPVAEENAGQYPKWLIRLLCCFIPKQKNRKRLRNKYIKK